MVLCFVPIFFSDFTRVIISIFYVAQSAKFFFQNLSLGYMSKMLNQIIFFFSSTKIRIFFSATLGIRIFYQKKKHKPPSFKLNGCSLNCFIFSDYDSLRDVRKKTTEWLILIKKKYEINSLHVYSCYDFICKELFVVRLQKNQYKSTVYTHNSYNM